MRWLLVCCVAVCGVVVIGGVRRLTHSGLSIVEWQPLVGIVPPVAAAQWQDVFAKYQQTPEYRWVNAGMSLDEFKQIYWVEWLHRVLGRLAGLVFAGPLLYWLARGRPGLGPGRAARGAAVPASRAPRLSPARESDGAAVSLTGRRA